MSQLIREPARRNSARYLEEEFDKDFEAAWAIFVEEEARNMPRQLEDVGSIEVEEQMERGDEVKDNDASRESSGNPVSHKSVEEPQYLLAARLLYIPASVKPLKRAGGTRSKFTKIGSCSPGRNNLGKGRRIVSGTCVSTSRRSQTTLKRMMRRYAGNSSSIEQQLGGSKKQALMIGKRFGREFQRQRRYRRGR
jgi:hypothetical protein